MVFVEVLNAAPPADGSQSATNPVPLRPGTFVHARIAGPTLPGAIAIPRDAISKGSVFVAEEGLARKRKLELGTTLQSLVVVEQGLKSGDRVVLTNLDVVRDQVRLEVTDGVTTNDELGRQRTPGARLLPREK